VTPHKSRGPKNPQKFAPKPPETRPAVGPVPSAVKELIDQPIPQYSPPIEVERTPFKIHWIGNDPFSLFIKFLGETSIIAIVNATNAKAGGQMGPLPHFARKWVPLTRGEFFCWLGLLIYMANYTGMSRQDHWPRLKSFMSQERWEQIHRFLTFNISTTHLPQPPPQPGPSTEPAWFRVEPVYSIIRSNCQEAITPSSWVSVDEAMVPFHGRSKHTVKMPGKPISQGFKLWVLGSSGGYYYDWLLHSSVNGPEACTRRRKMAFPRLGGVPPVRLAETFQVPVVLLKRLTDRFRHQKWLAFLDNLFLNLAVAQALLSLGVGVCRM
jgi:hypothetical protein